jgi:hypothetical protein
MGGCDDTMGNRPRAPWLERLRRSWAWRHKTKVMGVALSAAGYLQSNLASIGKAIPPHIFGAIIGAAGVLVFVLGFVNVFLPSDPQ